MAQDTVTNLSEVIAEVNALDEKIENMETLDTLEEIEANTETGVIAGALAVKELNSSLTNITADGAITSYDIEEGDVYINYTVGADSVRKKLGSEGELAYSRTVNNATHTNSAFISLEKGDKLLLTFDAVITNNATSNYGSFRIIGISGTSMNNDCVNAFNETVYVTVPESATYAVYHSAQANVYTMGKIFKL